MNQAIARARRHQGGFTLIELLVVIVILGILAAVVVFAVRGVGDKGKANAVATDERIIRTAEEAYCAKAGQYASMDQLTGQAPAADGNTYKFLSEPSTYHGVTYPAGDLGNCNGQKYGLTIDPTIPTTTTAPQGPPVCSQPDSFCKLGSAPTGNISGMVPLPTGKVVAFTRNPDGVSEYDPTVGTFGTWSKVADYDPIMGRGERYVAIGSRPPPFDDCGQNCGKVVWHDPGGGWNLYDPVNKLWLPAGAGSSDPGPTGGGTSSAYAAQIVGEPCGQYCGNVLMIYGTGPGRQGKAWAELWDPKTTAFTPVGYLGGPELGGGNPTSIVAMPNGQVLVTPTDRTSNDPKWTKIFDPTTTPPTFLNGDDHGFSHDLTPAVLANGDVLFLKLNSPGVAEVFHAGKPTGQQWGPGPYCGAPTQYCGLGSSFPIAGNPRAGVLAVSYDPSGANLTVWRMDSRQPTLTWTKVAGAPQGALRFNVVIGGTCPPSLCGKVLFADSGFSQMYMPPS